MNIKDLIGEATEYDKKLTLEEKKPKSWCGKWMRRGTIITVFTPWENGAIRKRRILL